MQQILSLGAGVGVDAIYASLSEQIARGEFLRGSRLPTEAELSARFGAGRSAVRKALGRLKDEGVIVSRQGSGSYVAKRPPMSVDAPRGINSFADVERLFEFRMLLEVESVRLAALNRTDADLEAIEAREQLLREAIRRGGMGAAEDFDLHVQVARASANRFLLSAILQLQTNVLFGTELGRQMSVLPPQVRLELVEAEHRAVVEPLRRRDPDQAQAAMRRHIELSFRRMCDGEL